MNNTHAKFFANRIHETTPSINQISRLNLDLPLRQQSIQSLHKRNKHYKEFQHALYMLKISIEELWRLELERLHNHKPISSNLLNNKFDLKVPSIYSCRAVLPVSSETIYLKNKVSSSINSPIILQASPTTNIHKTISNKISQSNIQSIQRTQNSTGSLLSINKKQKQYGFGDNFTKYWTKTALLHLKFQCSKHTH